MQARSLDRNESYYMSVRVPPGDRDIIGLRGAGEADDEPIDYPLPIESRTPRDQCGIFMKGSRTISNRTSYDWSLTLRACTAGSASLTAKLLIPSGEDDVDAEEVGSDTHYVQVTPLPPPPNTPPDITSGLSSVTYGECRTGSVGSYSASDPDGDSISWSLPNTTFETDRFDFDISSSGVLTFDSPPDYEDPEDSNNDNIYRITVRASDGSLSADRNVTITVGNRAPTITSGLSSTRYDEGQTGPVGTYRASDRCGGSISWSLPNTTFETDRFDLSISSSGVLTFDSSPDYENPEDSNNDNIYRITVRASDGSLSADRNVTITVGNRAPTITSGLSSTRYDEGQTGRVGTYRASDPGGGSISWSLPNTTFETDRFDLSISSSGVLTFDSPPDYEDPEDSNNDNVYKVTVRASDGSLSADRNVTITVGNRAPTITSGLSSTRYDEGQTGRVGTYRASDPGGGSISWSLPNTTFETDRFDLSISSSGVLTFDSSPDYEDPEDSNNDNIYRITVRASDGSLSADRNVTITVGNRAPTITSGLSSTRYDEGQTGRVGTYRASDPGGGSISWSLPNTTFETDRFDFDISSSGVLTFDSPPDYEDPEDSNNDNIYRITVRASDGSLSADRNVTITVGNRAPTITSGLSSTRYDEGQTGPVGTYRASDRCGGSISWSLPNTTFETDRFDLSISSSGVLTFDSSPDYENPEDSNNDNIYRITVRASDGSLSADRNVTITVGNRAPTITSGLSSTRYDEGQTGRVGTYRASDPGGGSISWSLPNTTFETDRFDLSISSSGVLTFDSPPDYEDPEDSNNDNVYKVTVRASDGSLSADRNVTITVGNRAPTITSGLSSTRYDEGQTGRVGTYRASDPGGGSISWSLPNTTFETDRFDLSISSSGVLTFDSSPDYEDPEDSNNDNVYRVTVRASDGRRSTSRNVTVTVTNRPPTFDSGPFAPDYAEGGTGSVGNYRASDPGGGSITWSLPNTTFETDQDEFNISSSGALTFDSPPDYENPEDSNNDNVYKVTVRASDGSLSTDRDVTVTVTDVNELSPPTNVAIELVANDNDALDVTFTPRPTPPHFYEFRLHSAPNQTGPYELLSTTEEVSASPARFNSLNTGRWYRAQGRNCRTAQRTDSNCSTWGADSQAVNLPIAPPANLDLQLHPTIDDALVLDFSQSETPHNYQFQLMQSPSETGTYSDHGSAVNGLAIDINFEGLTKGRWYKAKGRNCHNSDRTGCGEWSESNATYLTTLAPPPAPTGLRAAPGSCTSIELRWDPVNGASSYLVELLDTARSRSTGDEPQASEDEAERSVRAPYDPVYEGSATNTEVTGLVLDGGYNHIRVLAYGDGVTYAPEPRRGADATFPSVTITAAVTFDAEEYSLLESGQLQTVTVERTCGFGKGITVPITQTLHTAESDDYTVSGLTNNSLIFLTGQASKSFSIRSNPDNSDCYDETATLGIGALPAGVVKGIFPEASLIIKDDDQVCNPMFDAGGPIAVTYDEDGTGAVATYSATNPNGGGITWSLTGDDIALLTISSTGILRFATSPDYESPDDSNTDNVYDVTVVATENTPASLSASKNVAVTVGNVEEQGEVTLAPATRLSVGTVITATLSDDDVVSGAPAWQWQRTMGTVWEDISLGTQSTYTVADYDRDSWLRATVTYDDGYANGNTAESDGVQVPLGQVPPAFSGPDPATREVEENVSVGSEVGGAIEASDGNHDPLTYSLGGRDAASFHIDSSSGQLRTNVELNFEMRDSYVVEVSVRDGKDMNGNPDTVNDATITVNINVENVDEPGIVTLSSTSPRVNTQVSATLLDPDRDVSNESWQWQASPDGVNDWQTIAEDRGNTYTPRSSIVVPQNAEELGDVGKRLRAIVTYDDGESPNKQASSDASAAVPTLPVVTVSAHQESVTGGQELRFTLTASFAPTENMPVNVLVDGLGVEGISLESKWVTIDAQSTTADFIIETMEDEIDELDDVFIVSVFTNYPARLGVPAYYYESGNRIYLRVLDDEELDPPTGLSGNGNILNGEVQIWWQPTTGATTYDLRYAAETCDNAPNLNDEVECVPGTFTTVSGIISTSKMLSAGTGPNDQLDPTVSTAQDIPEYPVYRLQVRATNAYGESEWSQPAFISPTSAPPMRATVASIGSTRSPYIATAPLYAYQPKNDRGEHEFSYIICDSTIPSDISVYQVAGAIRKWEIVKKDTGNSLIVMKRITDVPSDACQPPINSLDPGVDINEVKFADDKSMERALCADTDACWRSASIFDAWATQGLGPNLLPMLPGEVVLRKERKDGTSWRDEIPQSSPLARSAPVPPVPNFCTVVDHIVTHEVGHALGIGRVHVPNTNTIVHPRNSMLSIMATGFDHHTKYCEPQAYDVVALMANYQSR